MTRGTQVTPTDHYAYNIVKVNRLHTISEEKRAYYVQSESAKQDHWKKHCDPETSKSRNGGSHWTYLSDILKASGTGFVAGSGLTVADFCLADLAYNYMRNFPTMKETYPEIVTHHDMVFNQAAVREYVSSGKQFDKINNNGLG